MKLKEYANKIGIPANSLLYYIKKFNISIKKEYGKYYITPDGIKDLDKIDIKFFYEKQKKQRKQNKKSPFQWVYEFTDNYVDRSIDVSYQILDRRNKWSI